MIDVILALKFVHVLFAAVMFGAWFAVACFMVFARRSGNASVVALVSLFAVRIELFVVAPAMVLQQVIGQGYLLSSLDIFYFSGWLVMLLIPLCWLVRRPSSGTAAVGGE